ncbi:MAG: HEAT repeat domain-containing protein [Singulisphaera sp.]
MSEQVHQASWYGKNWSIPIAAGILKKTEMTGSRSFGGDPNQPFSVADEAIEEFQRLTGKDFGYEKGAASGDAWTRSPGASMVGGGRARVPQNRIAEDHPPVEDPGDLFLTDEEIDRRVAAIEGDDPVARWRTITSLGKVSSYKVQRALLNASGQEVDREVKLAILRALKEHPEPWHLPALTRLLEQAPDTPTRVVAGQMIRRLMGGNGTRLESREGALDAARRLVRDEGTPIEIRRRPPTSWRPGLVRGSPLREAIADDPAFREQGLHPARLERRFSPEHRVVRVRGAVAGVPATPRTRARGEGADRAVPRAARGWRGRGAVRGDVPVLPSGSLPASPPHTVLFPSDPTGVRDGMVPSMAAGPSSKRDTLVPRHPELPLQFLDDAVEVLVLWEAGMPPEVLGDEEVLVVVHVIPEPSPPLARVLGVREPVAESLQVADQPGVEGQRPEEEHGVPVERLVPETE